MEIGVPRNEGSGVSSWAESVASGAERKMVTIFVETGPGVVVLV